MILKEKRSTAAIAACAMLVGCGGAGSVAAPASVAVDWRRIATPADRERLRNWRTAWVAALGQIRADGRSAAIAADPVLFDPDHAMADAVPPAGAYRCRVAKLGSGKDGGPAFMAYPWFRCRVGEGAGARTLDKIDGSQRASGTVYADTDARSIFLGTLVLGDETRAMAYGRDASRDMAGVIERIGTRRWRMVLPYPKFESTIDLVDLVPAG